MSKINTERQERLFRHYTQSNKRFAWLAMRLADIVLLLARPLPARLQNTCESLARLLKNMAQLITQPEYARTQIQPRVVLRALLDGAGIGALLGFAGAYYLPDNISLVYLVLFIAGLVLVMMMMFLISFLSISGDIYREKQDEYQKIVSNQASAYTLKAEVFLLLLLLISYLTFREWRSLIPAHLCLLLFLGRAIYLFKLTQLRWRDMAEIELEDSVQLQAAQGGDQTTWA